MTATTSAGLSSSGSASGSGARSRVHVPGFTASSAFLTRALAVQRRPGSPLSSPAWSAQVPARYSQAPGSPSWPPRPCRAGAPRPARPGWPLPTGRRLPDRRPRSPSRLPRPGRSPVRQHTGRVAAVLGQVRFRLRPPFVLLAQERPDAVQDAGRALRSLRRRADRGSALSGRRAGRGQVPPNPPPRRALYRGLARPGGKPGTPPQRCCATSSCNCQGRS